MNLALVFLLILCVTPLFFGRTRQLPGWLMLQGLALAWYSLTDQAEPTLHDIFTALEILLLRAVIAPWMISQMLVRRQEPDLELMPSNLFTWGIAIGLIALSFEFAQAVASDGDVLILGVVAAAVAMALLLLSTNDTPPTQLVALLYLETALALFETLLPEAWPLPAHIAVSSVYVLTVAIGCWLLSHANTVTTLGKSNEPTTQKDLG